MREVPISCRFRPFPVVAATPSRVWVVSDILLLFVNGSDLLAVTRRDMDATWRTLGTLCRELDWSKRRLIHELCNGLRYRTIPEGYVIEWDNDFLWPYLNVEASEISVPYGLYAAGVAPPPPKTRAGLDQGLTLGIEVLPPTDAEVPVPSASAPAAPPALPRKVSEADLRKAVLAIVEEHPPGSRPPDEESLHEEVERRVGAQLARDRVLAARDKVAPHFKLPVGRPRKNAQ
jgi:hypothetical protein